MRRFSLKQIWVQTIFTETNLFVIPNCPNSCTKIKEKKEKEKEVHGATLSN